MMENNHQHKLTDNELLHAFKFQSLINQSQSDKTLYLLGNIQNLPGQAILIITPLIYNPDNIHFQHADSILTNDIYHKFTASLLSQAEIQLIYPASEKLIAKYTRKEKVIVRESGESYAKKRDILLQGQLKHIQWVQNICKGISEAQKVLFRNKDMIILPDFKCTDISQHSTLHLLLIFNDPVLTSIRDLKSQNLPLLKAAQENIQQLLQEHFKLTINSFRVYFHYPPTFYRLHIHVMWLGLQSTTSLVQRCHELSTVIDNIGMRGDYYQEMSLNTFEQK